MISLHITVYALEDQVDRYKVSTVCPDSGELLDVTDQYDVVAMASEEGQEMGFAVLKVPAVGSGAAGGEGADQGSDSGGA